MSTIGDIDTSREVEQTVGRTGEGSVHKIGQ
jgi:hypothetical protein